MRKIMLTVVATCAVAALIPATALAHGSHHRHHHARIHHRTFGHDWSTSANPGSTSAEQNAGTVQSFMNGVLTIALNGGSTTVSGQVTPGTEIECGAPEPASMSSHDRGDDNGGGDDQGDDQGEDQNENEAAQNCDSSALTPGTVVHEARLRLSGNGASWDKVELVTSATSSSSSFGDH
jgi:hypothetical protein